LVATRIQILRITIKPFVVFALAALFSLLSILIWYVLLRPVAERVSEGIVHSATPASAETIERLIPRSHRNLEHTPRTIKYEIPERYIYEVELTDTGERLNFSNMSPKLEFETGERVSIRYVERSLPLIWKKRFILSVTPAQ